MEKLVALGISKNVMKFIAELVFVRRAHFYIMDRLGNHHLLIRLLYKGLPQGGVLSPLLYILYIKSTNVRIPTHTIILKFADDMALLTTQDNYTCLPQY